MTEKQWIERLVADFLKNSFMSPNQLDPNFESANMVDGLFAIAGSLRRIAEAIEDRTVLEKVSRGLE